MSSVIAVLIIVAAALGLLILLLQQRHKKALATLQKAHEESAAHWQQKHAEVLEARRKSTEEWESQRARFEAEINSLAKYRSIQNVQQEIERRQNAYIEAEKAARDRYDKFKLGAKEEIKKAEEEAAAIRSEARKVDRESATERQEMLASASREVSRIIDQANAKAEEIAGDALTALRDAHHLEETARAMRNQIKGYGDEYLIPNLSLLDELAEDFSHKQAGRELKIARSRTRQMVTEGLAADCDYVEKNRKETAIHFVLDAFNGKVDSILTKVKHDNFGKLEQEIKDAFHTVNHNGTAFRDARIRADFLDARLSELRWGVAANELKLQEREEQRRIKQEMREEERARREYEKAIKEAEREEKMLAKAMEQARRELAAASEERKAEFERQLQELEEKLTEAEAKNQRALSMAQQTKRGHVYIISNVGSFGEDVFKIGLTRRLEPLERVKELGDASVPFEFDVHAMIFDEDAPALEAKLHGKFQESQLNKVNPRKEFFRVNLLDIRSTIDELALECHWTMKAEAREYRETLAIEQQKAKELANSN